MKTLIIFLFLICPALVMATEPSIPADLQAAMLAVEKDKTAVASAQTAFDAAKIALTSGTTQLAADILNERALHDKYYPSPTPQPTPNPDVTTHVVSVVMVGGAGCPPCKLFGPVIKQLASEGQNITEVDAATPAGAAYGVSSTPTFILLVDGKEVNRSAGFFTPPKKSTDNQGKNDIKAWIDACKKWVKEKYPKDEVK